MEMAAMAIETRGGSRARSGMVEGFERPRVDMTYDLRTSGSSKPSILP